MCYCDAERPAFSNRSHPKAVKIHWCCECGAGIRPGTRYQRTDGMWDNQFSTFIRCRECADTVRFMTWWSKQVDGCFCEVFGDLMESVQDAWRERKTKLVGIAYIAMQRRWYRDRDERRAAYEARRAMRKAA